ncbi:MAG: DNA polymerase IV [Clostridia bacterium]|nr:DNA polymerase IV [Clostridia bacterium]
MGYNENIFMEKVILHCDLNNFYASVEQKNHPEYNGMPLAVSGNPEKRHGIILAKNYLAKEAGVQTGEAIWVSKQKCPNIILVPPHFEEYVKYSEIVRSIYTEFTDRVESFGLDECWLDITGSLKFFGKSPKELADTIRETVKARTGLTISVGVSFTKVLAKLGSDLKKPDATSVLMRSNYMDIIGDMSPAELIMVGRRTAEKLKKLNIHNIRQLASASRDMLRQHFGIVGEHLVDYASGIEHDEVKHYYDTHVPKSISNGTTTPKDITSLADAKTVIYALTELIATRMRKFGLVANGVSLSIRYAQNLETISRHTTLEFPTSNASDFAKSALELLKEMHTFPTPLRAITVGAIRLENASVKQLCLIEDNEKEEKLETSIDAIRNRFGYNSITRGVVLGNNLTGNLHEEDGFEPFKR